MANQPLEIFGFKGLAMKNNRIALLLKNARRIVNQVLSEQ
jgi:hypothetical protein